MNTDKTHSCVCDFITNAEAIPIEFWFPLGNINIYKCPHCNSIYKSQFELLKLTRQQFWAYYLPCLYWFLQIIRFFQFLLVMFIFLRQDSFTVYIVCTMMIHIAFYCITNFIIFGNLIVTETHINKMYKDRIDLCVKTFSKSK